MKLPEITHLQFLILGLLMEGETPGHKLRDLLAKQGIKKDGPAFYQLMARLEDDKLVEGWYAPRIVGDQKVKERRYKMTGRGESAWEATSEFYARNTKLAMQGG